MNIYVGSLPYDTTEEDLQSLLETYGQVSSTAIPTDKQTGRRRGFGFVKMPDATEAAAAIVELNGREWLGRILKVEEAQPKRPRQDREP